jgi:hypothetical protein
MRTIAILALGVFATVANAQQVALTPVTDVMEVMREHAGIAETNLWPGFNVKEIPVAVYDSVSTWLFFADQPPEGFRQSDEGDGVFVFEGQHPLVWGNSVVRFGETWTATSVLSNYSRRTNERYTPKDLAGIIVHEQFHVFQRTNHPGWRQNDGVLLFYPEETQEALFLRRIEKETFKSAVLSDNRMEIVGWATTALGYRRERLDRIPAPFGDYERDLQRTEGLSDYIERISRGVDPLNASNMTNGIAPAGIRDLGYWEGRWIAMILDKLSPDWKMTIESNDTLYLEEILESVIIESPTKKKTFSQGEIKQLRFDSDSVFDDWQYKKAGEIESYKNLPGYSIEISSISSPLNIRIFEPLEIEILADRTVFHRLIFSAANQKATIRILNHPCITYFDESFRLVKLCIYGLPEAPEVITEGKKLILKYRDISLELNYSELEIEGSDFRVTI